MKLNKLYIGLAALAGIFTSCSDNDDNVVPGKWDAADGFYNISFPKTTINQELDPQDETTATIEITRKNTSGAATVPFEIKENTDEVFDVKAAEFADGQETAQFTVNFPKAEVGKTYTLNITVSDPQFTSAIYSQNNSVTFNVTRVKWNDTGYYIDSNGVKQDGWALYTEDFLTTFYGVQNVTFPTRLQERDDRPGYFRMVNTYGENYIYNDPGDWDETMDYYIYIDATDPDKVYIPEKCHTGMSWTYGAFRVFSLAGYYLAKGDKQQAEDYYGTYANGKITFPAGSLLLSMDDYNDGGLYTSNNNGKFKLVIDPSKDLYEVNLEEDCEWEELYNGDFISSQLGTTASRTIFKGNITTTKDDCDKRFLEEYGTPYLIEDAWGSGSNLVFCTKNGKIYLPEEFTLQPTGLEAVGQDVYAKINTLTSKYTDNVITLNITYQTKDGKLVYGEAEEKFLHITYTPIGTADYTYTFLDETTVKGLTLSKRDDKDDVYMVSDWGYGVGFLFTWDKKTNECTVEGQPTGLDHPSYGMVYVSDAPTYNSQKYSYNDYPCVYDPTTKTFTFNLMYYVSAGSFGIFTESLTISLDAVSSAAPRAAALSSRDVNFGTIKKDNIKWNRLFMPKKVDVKSMNKNATPFIDFGF